METTATRRIAERFSRLSTEQRRVVYEGIRSKGLTLDQFPILPREDAAQDRCHVSYAQQRQWFLWQLDPQSTAYHISDALKLTARWMWTRYARASRHWWRATNRCARCFAPMPTGSPSR